MTNKEIQRIKMMAAKAKEAKAKREAEAEAEARKKVRRENLGFKIDLLNENLEKYGFVSNGSPLIQCYTMGNIEVSYEGGELIAIEIEEESIEEIFDIPEASGPDDSLCYRITDEAITYLRELIVK